MTFLTLLAASILGGFISQLTSFWILGRLALRQQRINEKMIRQALEEHNEMLDKERERIKKYAQMES